MVFNATFNNISVISWWSVLLVEETGENHKNTIWRKQYNENRKSHLKDFFVFLLIPTSTLTGPSWS